MRRVLILILVSPLTLVALPSVASAHTGMAVPACAGFSYELTEFGPFANSVSYDVQGPTGQVASGTIGPFGASSFGTVPYGFTGAGRLEVYFAWTLPDNTAPATWPVRPR